MSSSKPWKGPRVDQIIIDDPFVDPSYRMPEPGMRYTLSFVSPLDPQKTRFIQLIVGKYSEVRRHIDSAKDKGGVVDYRVHATWKLLMAPCDCKWCKGGSLK